MLILGINNMHDASAVLVRDGVVIAAAEEERFNRKKHTTGVPIYAIRFCLQEGGISYADLDYIGVGWKYWVLRKRLTETLRSSLHSFRAFGAKMGRGAGQMRHEWFQLFQLHRILREAFGETKAKIVFLDHHLCHAVSTFFVSPFERAAILTVDGAGEEMTSVFALGEGENISFLQSVKLPHSLGQFYAAMTGFLGFHMQSDEYKVMGLAAYGEPVFNEFLKTHVLRETAEGTFLLNPRLMDYHLARSGVFSPELQKVFGPPRNPEDEEITPRHQNIAASAQERLEEVLFHMARNLYRITGTENLCLAGGVGFNCVANGKLFQQTPFRNIFVQPAAGDAGTALGAALYLYHRQTAKPRRYTMEHAYLGPEFTETDYQKVLDRHRLKFTRFPDANLFPFVAERLADGALVCWFQGRMEWGPRALGNRSILADPRNKHMKDIINLKVKLREPFRPFAPSVLEQSFSDFFDGPAPSPYMLFAYPVKSSQAARIPAVVHVDGTARPQSVHAGTNQRYWQLIKAFENITGTPMLLNTSFNVQEPIVCTPEEAVNTFLKTQIDYLVLGNFVAENPHGGN